MSTIKIRMKVEASGPDGMVQPGEEVEVGEATGGELIAAGLADPVEEEVEAPIEEVMTDWLADAPFDAEDGDEETENAPFDAEDGDEETENAPFDAEDGDEETENAPFDAEDGDEETENAPFDAEDGDEETENAEIGGE